MYSESSNKKRTAEAAGMGSPDQQSTTKKTRREAALEASLNQLKRALGPDELPPEWEDYDPGHFMEGMGRMGRVVNALTRETVQEYISDGFIEDDLTTLDIQESKIQRIQNPTDPQLTQTVRRQMIEYVVRVRTRLKGQS
jgi:hypothetical protein